jgi:hypothetical protein
VRVLAESLGGGRQARRVVAAHCIHGVDIDARAVAAARTAIERFVGEPVPALARHLRIGDALSIDWPIAFDAVLANPPYIRQELVQDKQRLQSFAAYDGVADLYVYFIELAQRLAPRYCLVVPNKWLTAGYGRPLRRLLSRLGSVEGVVDFASAQPLFADADAFPCIVWGDRTTATTHVHASRVTQATTSVADALATPGPVQLRARWTDAPWHIDTEDDAAVLERIARGRPTLGELIGTRWSRGVVTGCNRAFVIDRDTRDRLLACEPAAATLVRPFIKGRDIRPWRAAPSDRFVLLVDRDTSLTQLPHVRAHLEPFRSALEPRPRDHRGPWHGRKPGAYRWYELQDPVVPLAKARTPRLFYQDIQTQPACCLDPTGELVPDTTVWILPSADPFLLAVLNSPLYAWYARRRFPPALNGAVRPKLEYMRALPIAAPSSRLRRQVEALVRRQLDEPADARDHELAAFVAEAYGLTPSERALVGS